MYIVYIYATFEILCASDFNVKNLYIKNIMFLLNGSMFVDKQDGCKYRSKFKIEKSQNISIFIRFNQDSEITVT